MPFESIAFALGAVVLLVAAVLALRRSRTAGVIRMPVVGASAPGTSPDEDWPPDAASIPDEQLVPLHQPLLQRAFLSALKEKQSMGAFVVRRGGQVYVTFQAITDPVERERAYAMFGHLNSDADVDVREMIHLVNKMMRGHSDF